LYPSKEIDRQDIQALHRVRERLIGARTALINEVHGLMLEYGIVLPTGVAKFRQAVVERLEADKDKLTALSRLMTIPGIGAITATALVAAVGAVGLCKNGR
jgi:transposase